MTENLNFQCFNLKELRGSNFKCSEIKIIDLRHPNEASSLGINQTNIEVLSIPYYLLKTNLSNLNKETHYALYCKDGIMSRLQAGILKDKGFTKISVIRDLSQQT